MKNVFEGFNSVQIGIVIVVTLEKPLFSLVNIHITKSFLNMVN